MIRDITIGRYYDSESVIHRMDPRTKLMGVLVYIISLFLVKNVWWYLGCLIVMLVLYRLARVPVGYLLKGLRGILVLLCFTFLFRMLYTFFQIWSQYKLGNLEFGDAVHDLQRMLMVNNLL